MEQEAIFARKSWYVKPKIWLIFGLVRASFCFLFSFFFLFFFFFFALFIVSGGGFSGDYYPGSRVWT
jgi:hypothetical protein